jgi:hypothetical protein
VGDGLPLRIKDDLYHINSSVQQTFDIALKGGEGQYDGYVSVSGIDDAFTTTITIYVREYGVSIFDKHLNFTSGLSPSSFGNTTTTSQDEGEGRVNGELGKEGVGKENGVEGGYKHTSTKTRNAGNAVAQTYNLQQQGQFKVPTAYTLWS